MAPAKGLDERLIDRMFELEEQYRNILEARTRNRNSLRDLANDGMLSAEQAAAVRETYRERAPRGSNGPAAE